MADASQHLIYLWHIKYNKVLKTLPGQRGTSTGGKRIGKQYILSIYEEDQGNFTDTLVRTYIENILLWTL